jgi:superfamily I DNA and RNA helicase
VTLATVHKAKGNEAFIVYVIGVDAVMFLPDVRKRNMLFTAMTRAKGWVRVSGVGENAAKCQREMAMAKAHFPSLEFMYPNPEQLKVMKRDIAAAADKRLRARRMLEQLQEEYTPDEIEQIMNESRRQPGSQKVRRKGGGKG